MHPLLFFHHWPLAFPEATHLTTIISPQSHPTLLVAHGAPPRNSEQPIGDCSLLPSSAVLVVLQMDKPGVDRKMRSKKGKAKKEQIKVVYISNPMRVKATEAEFKGLVQELTGRDSDIADRLSGFGEVERRGEGAAAADQDSISTDGSLLSTAYSPCFGNAEVHPHHYQQQQQQRDPYISKGTPFDVLDDDLTAQILGDFVPSSSYYESFPPAGR